MINFRLPLIIVISSLLIMLAIIPTMYFRLKKDMMEDYDFLGHGITNFMKDEINADIVDEYIEKNVEMEEYNRIVEDFYRIRDNYPDVLYMYVYRYKKDGAHVVFDINNLKYVNDTFGHEQGDNYIVNCCNMIHDIYSNSPMFRLGGDEFVVLLKSEDYADRNELLEIIKRSFINTYEQEDKKLYERYSASMGMAEYTESDNDPEQVLRRADEAMYCYKTEFKKKYGSYR